MVSEQAFLLLCFKRTIGLLSVSMGIAWMRFVSDMWCFEVSSYRKTYLKITLRWFPHWSQHTCRKSHVFLKWEWSFWVKTLNFQLPSFSRNERNLPLSFWKAADWEFSFQELGLIAGWFKRNWVAMKLGVPFAMVLLKEEILHQLIW